MKKVLKALREKAEVTHKRKLIRTTADFSEETMEARRVGSKAFPVLKDYEGQPKLIYPAKLFAIVEEERKALYNINRLKNYTTKTNPPKKNHRKQYFELN